MEEWKTYKLGDLCRRVCSGGTPKSTCEEYYGGDIPWLNTKEINFNRIYSTEANITQSGLENSSAKWVDTNSIIVAMYGNTAGKVAISKIPLTTNQACCNLMIDSSRADYRYVFYYLCSKYIEIKAKANGAAQQNLNAQQIRELDIKLPSLQEQSRISDILTSLDDKIELNNRINHNLEQQAQALYKSWFVDFEPFKDGKFVDSELGLIPEGWNYIPFNSFIAESKVKTGELGVKEFSVTNNGIIPRDSKYNKSLSASSANNKLILYGDLVFGMSREILNWGVMTEEKGGVSPAYKVFHINFSVIDPVYLKLYIQSHLSQFSDLIRPAAREGQGIDKKLLQDKMVLLPTMDVLKDFWPLYNTIICRSGICGREITELSDIRDLILPKLMSGELKINDLTC